MCGISGIRNLDGAAVDAALLARMAARLRHRGPDAVGVMASGCTGLAHARLSIIDLEGGGQPMFHHNGSLCVAFHGEIFNYIELREELRAQGHSFHTRSDTEVLLHAYSQYGTALVDRLNGQWAFALWDRREDRVILSRDRLGICPLFYAVCGRKLLFGSEIKALFADPDVPRAIDVHGLGQVFTFWATLPPRTVFRGIRELPPGHNLIVDSQGIRVQRYWGLDYEPASQPQSTDEYADELLAILEDATRLRLRCDVPAGAYLSGGLDSSLTTALVRQVSNTSPRTFSIAFELAEFDESAYQRAVVDRIGTDHREVRCRAADIGGVFPDVVRHAEVPLLRTAPAPMYLLARLVREQGYKVIVTGEGADEMLGGYDIFKEAKIRRFMARGPDSAFRRELLRRLYPYLPDIRRQPAAYRQSFFQARPEDLADALFSHRPRWRVTSRLWTFFSRDVRAEVRPEDLVRELEQQLPEAFRGWPPLCQAQFLESTILMPGYLLSSQGDRMAMAHSVEARYPFLDHRLVEFAARLPCRLKMHGLNEKFLLKKAAGHLIPARVARRSKQPYRSPDAASFLAGPTGARREPAWLEYVEQVLAPRRLADTGLFEPSAVEALLNKCRHRPATSARDNMALVGILSTQLLVSQLIENEIPSVPSGVPVHEEYSGTLPGVHPGQPPVWSGDYAGRG